MNLLARKIGIWFKTVVWRDMMFREILEHMPEEAVERAYCGVNGATIKLVDNSVIEFIPANTASRGVNIFESYLQEGISEKIAHDVIGARTKNPAQCFVVGCYDDLINPMRMSKYYALIHTDRNEYGKA